MSILDDAIREHLELKRAHGADATELKKLEDEAFGPPARPDELGSLAEAPTEFLATEAEDGGDVEAEPGGRRLSNIADLQEAPAPRPAESPEETTPVGETQEADGASEAAPSEEPEPPAEEEHPAMEHRAVPEPEPEADIEEPSHSTGERHAIAEQPTEHFDVQAEIDSEAASPSDEELLDAELGEPRVTPVGPAAEDDDDEFFSEQRLSDELSQALDAPVEEEELEDEEPEDLGEDEDEELEDEGEEEPSEASGHQHEDVLEDTPDFLEDTPEDDDLWFEQRPPKDFDFDD